MTAIRTTRTGETVHGFRAWRRRRPLIGGILLVLSGIEMFFSGQLDLGNIKIQMGFEGFQATVIPALMAVLGILIIVTPAQRMFFGIFALILAVYSLVGVNVGGFILGMLLGAVGGVIVVAWRPKEGDAAAASAEAAESEVADPAPVAAPAVTVVRHDHGAVVHAEYVDYATLRARADAKRAAGGGSSASTTAAEPRPFARSRS
jgi:hypothetical protein